MAIRCLCLLFVSTKTKKMGNDIPFIMKVVPVIHSILLIIIIKCDLASENWPFDIFNLNGVISIMLKPLSSGACGASIRTSVSEL